MYDVNIHVIHIYVYIYIYVGTAAKQHKCSKTDNTKQHKTNDDDDDDDDDTTTTTTTAATTTTTTTAATTTTTTRTTINPTQTENNTSNTHTKKVFLHCRRVRMLDAAGGRFGAKCCTPEIANNEKYIGSCHWKSVGYFQYKSTGQVTVLWILPLRSEVPLGNATENQLGDFTGNP